MNARCYGPVRYFEGVNYRGMGGTTLQWIAAGGTAVSITTLLLTVGFRWWDGRTQLALTYTVKRGARRGRGVELTITNISKSPVYIRDAYLELPTGGKMRNLVRLGSVTTDP